MRYKRICSVFIAVSWALLLLLGLVETSFAASEAVANSEGIETSQYWPMAAWYGLSVLLALIGYVKAKSKS
ncbi:MAG: hypothetical protein ACU85E_13390 [Gammaproteobacteria bacterium]